MLEIPFAEQPQPAIVDLDSWPRRDHFFFYKDFVEPFFSVTAEVVCSGLVRSCKAAGLSPTLRLWHGVLRAVNEIEAFSLRIVDDQAVRFPRIHLSPTVARPDETFAIGFLPYLDSFEEFSAVATPLLAEARASTGFKLDLAKRRVDLIHFSTLPWIRFTGLSHARYMTQPESEPKITLGRFADLGGEVVLPVSVTVHHGLADGLHVSRFLGRLEEIFAEPVYHPEG